MSRVPRSGLRRSVFAVDGSEGGEQRRKRHRESGDRLRCTAGLHLPIQSKGAKCDSRRPKIFRLALRSTRHRTHKPLTFNIKGAHFSKSQKTQNHTFSSRHFAPLCAVALPSRSPIGGGAPIDKPTGRCPTLRLPRRPPCRDEENNTTFAPKSTPFRPKCTTLRPFPTRGRHDTRSRIAHSASSQFLPSPFTFTPIHLIHKLLRVNFTLIFCFTEVKAKGVKPSHLSPYCPTIYAQ